MNSIARDVPGFGDLTNVSVEKLEELEKILGIILALPIARDTFAQIIEGTPTRTPFSDEIKESKLTYRRTVIVNDKAKPSDEAVQKFKEIRSAFEPQNLIIDLKVAQNYQSAPWGSHEHQLRLLEIAAASVHALAGMLYAAGHKDMDLKPPEPEGGSHRLFHKSDGFYVNFYHTNYRHFFNYPFGLLNIVGYWTEVEIFGGVLLFERDEEGSGIINAFSHPQRSRHAFKLSDKQLQCFADMSKAGVKSPSAEDFLPFAEETAARRELTYVTMGEGPLRIYKNEYDQQPPEFPERPSCVKPQDEGLAVSSAEAVKIAKEKGWFD